MKAREKILIAADKLFGEAGYDATSTREIAELCDVNKALIHYHFKSKEALLEAVLDNYYGKLNKTILEALRKEGSVRDKLLALIDVYTDFLASNLNFSRIIQRESSGGKLQGLISRNMLPVFRMGEEMIHGAYPETRSGVFAAHHLMVSFFGMVVGYYTYSGVLKDMIGGNPLSKKELEDRKKHLFRMFDIIEKEMIAENGTYEK